MLTCSECGRRHTISRNEYMLMSKEWIFSFDVIFPKAKITNLSPLNIDRSYTAGDTQQTTRHDILT